jgi:hypothetical protein
VIRVLLAVLLLAASVAEALDVDLEPYREARRAGAVGQVAGRVLAEPARPNTPGRPFVGTTVTLLPRSPSLLGTFESLKRGARDSAQAFRDAAPAMRKAREVYERELLEAGVPDLTPLLQVDADGTFRFEDVPAGAWIVLAWYSVPNDVATARINPKERALFPTLSRLRGFQAVTVWLREVSLAGGTTVSVELNDRNQWFRGVIEERLLDAVGR